MRAGFAFGILAIALGAPVAASAQSGPDDRGAALARAEEAATQAERAADEAEHAAAAARRAATNARSAVNEARVAMGLGVAPPTAVAAQPQAPAVARDDDPLPPDENLPVHPAGNGAAAAPVGVATGQHRVFVDQVAASVANGPNGSDLKSGKAPDFQLVATAKDKTASLSWTLDISGQQPGDVLSTDQVTLSASTKLDDEGNAQLLDINGFTSGTELKFSYIHYGSSVHLTGKELDPVAAARDLCEKGGGTKSACDPYGYATGVGAFVAKYNPGAYDTMMNSVLPGPVWFYGLSVTGNQATYKYLDRTTFKMGKEDHFGFGGTAFGGLLLDQGDTSVTGSFTYRRRYKEQDSLMLCQPVAGTTQTQCLTGADGAPLRKTQSVVGLELRHAFPAPLGEFASLAIAPKASFDIGSDAYSLDVPVYFADDGSGKLRGGVRATYLNQKDEKSGGRDASFAFGVFVGVPFTVFQK